MGDKPLLQKDTADGKAARTTIQTIVGFVAGLFTAVWQVPGVPEAVGHYFDTNGPGLLLALGISAAIAGTVGGAIAFVWNVLRGQKAS
jgi:hypothetical protein